MSAPRIDPAIERQILALWDNGERNKARISRIVKADRATVRRVLVEHGRIADEGGRATGAEEKPHAEFADLGRLAAEAVRVPEAAPEAKVETKAEVPPDAEKMTRAEKDDTASIDFTTDKRIRTLEDAIAYAEVDLTVWRVKRWSSTAWEVVLKVAEFAKDSATGKPVKVSERPVRKTMWRVTMDLERVLPKPFQDAIDSIYERMKQYSPLYPKAPVRKPPSKPHLLEVSLFDVHIGKLAWAKETGTDYDLKIAETIFRNAVEDLLNKAVGYNIERTLFTIGSDFYHIDNLNNTTTAGTMVDADGRYPKIIETGEMAVIWAIEYMLRTGPVHVDWIPGNHDRIASYHLARTVAAWFRNHPDVTVDYSPKVRKYLHYGTNLIGLTHGNQEKVQSLPVIMATEMPDEWAASTTREFHIGHWHTSRKYETLPVATHDGVVVRTLRSLSGTDAWTYGRGFVGSTRAAEGFLFSREDGFAANFIARARE